MRKCVDSITTVMLHKSGVSSGLPGQSVNHVRNLGRYIWNNPQLSIWDRTSGTTHNFLSITDLNNLQQSSVVYRCVKNNTKPLNLVSNQQLLICHKCEFMLKLFLLVPLEHSLMLYRSGTVNSKSFVGKV